MLDLSSYSVEELTNLQIAIPQEISRRQLAKREQVAKEIAAIAQAHGFSLEDLVGKAKAPAGKATGKVKPKYRNPADANTTWTGRGRQPAWVVAWLKAGKSLDDVAI